MTDLNDLNCSKYFDIDETMKNVHVVLLLAAVGTIALYWLTHLSDKVDEVGITSLIRGASSLITAAHRGIMSRVRLSFAKALYIDFPILMTLMSFERSVPKVAIATLFQEVRLSTKIYLMSFGFNQHISAISAGIAGGVVKYSITGQSRLIGSAATVAYEVCGNYKSCSDNPIVNIPLIIAIETCEQLAHGLMETGRFSMDALKFGVWLGEYVVITAYGLLAPAMNA